MKKVAKIRCNECGKETIQELPITLGTNYCKACESYRCLIIYDFEVVN